MVKFFFFFFFFFFFLSTAVDCLSKFVCFLLVSLVGYGLCSLGFSFTFFV